MMEDLQIKEISGLLLLVSLFLGIVWMLYRIFIILYSFFSKKLLFKDKTHSLAIIKILSGLTVFFLSSIFFVNFLLLLPMSKMGKPNINSDYDELVRGKLSYYIPDTMEVGERYIAKVAITKAISDSILLYGFSKNEVDENIIIDPVSISSRVKVSLVDPEGDNFYVKSINTDMQIVDSISNTVWKWYIIPSTSGENPLELTVSTRITDNHGSDFRDIPVFSERIIVKSNYWYSTKSFLEKYWQFILTAILIPLIVWRYNLYRKQQEEKKKKQEEELQKKLDEASKNTIGFKTNQKKPD